MARSLANRDPRVLYFTRGYTVHDQRFLTALVEESHEVHFLSLDRNAVEQSSVLMPPGVKQVDWLARLRSRHPWTIPRLVLSLKRAIRSVQPDLVHAGPLQSCAFLAALTGFRPLVSMSWGFDLLLDARRGPFWRWATRVALRRSASMIVDSQTLRRLAVDYGMRDNCIVMFPWGVDVAHFRPIEPCRSGPAEGDASVRILSSRPWEPMYGVDTIADAFIVASEILAARDDTTLSMTMLGGGSLAGYIRNVLGEGVVADRVDFVGYVPQQNMPACYQAADLYVSASHSDGTSISLLEAFACGLPAIVSDIPGNREWIVPGENGWLFRGGDSEDLAKRIVDAIGQRTRLQQMRRVSRTVAETRGDWSKNRLGIFQAYEIARTAEDARKKGGIR